MGKGNPYKLNNGRFGSADNHDYILYEPNKERQLQNNKNQANVNIARERLSKEDIDILNTDWVNGDHHAISKNPNGEQAQRVERVINKLPGHSGVIYRGSEDNPIRHSYKIGDEFSFNHIGAWSKKEGIAQIHAAKHTSPVIYRVKSELYGKDISQFVKGDKKVESEVLTSKTAKYTIFKKSKKRIPNLEGNGYTTALIIDLKERN